LMMSRNVAEFCGGGGNSTAFLDGGVFWDRASGWSAWPKKDLGQAGCECFPPEALCSDMCRFFAAEPYRDPHAARTAEGLRPHWFALAGQRRRSMRVHLRRAQRGMDQRPCFANHPGYDTLTMSG
jgi:hypothetical protein